MGRGGGGGLLPLTQHYSYSTQKNMDRTLIRRASNAAAQIYCNHGHTGYCFIYVCVLCTHLCRYCSDTDPTPVCVCALCTLTFPTDSVNTELVLLKSSCSKENQNLVLMEQNCIGLALIRANLVQEEEYFLS